MPRPDNTREVYGIGRKGLRLLELFETIPKEIERKRRAAQWMAEIPPEWTKNVERRVAREIAGWPDETSGEVKAGASSAGERIASGLTTFKASFKGAYLSLMETMFPSVAVPARLRAVRSGTVDPGETGPRASQDAVPPSALNLEEEEKIRARLPAWIVVPYADAPEDMPEFAILWAGEGDAPELPPLELRLHGQPRDENVFWPEVRTDVADLPPGKVTFVRFDTLKPRAATIIEREDGGLVIDFT